jgi:hypothetical protein
METLKAKAQNGRLVLDVPTKFPEGTVLNLTIAEDGHDLDDEEQAALDAALETSWQQAQAGKTRPADMILQELKERR